MTKGAQLSSDFWFPGDTGIPFEGEHEEEEEHARTRGIGNMERSVLVEVVLCSVVWLVAIYTAVFQSRAMSEEDVKFDMASVMVVSSGSSVLLALVWSVKEGDLGYWYGSDAAKDFALYIPAAIMFGVAEYVVSIAYTYLPADNIKVMAQSRVLIIALIAGLIFKRKLPATTWLGLASVTIVAACYVAMKTVDKQSQHYHGTLGAFKEAYANVEGDDADRYGEFNVALASRLEKAASKFLPGEENDSTVGWICVLIYIFLGCFAGVYCELFMKKKTSQPYYIQKTYLNITVIVVSVLLSWLIRPILVKNEIGGDKFKVNMFDNGLFYGLGDARVIGFIIFFTCSGWMKGLLVKKMSALAKQIVSVMVVVSLYFVMKVHKCPAGESGAKPFFCPANLGSMSKYVVVADLSVFLVVALYVSTLRDQKANQAKAKDRGVEAEPLLQQP